MSKDKSDNSASEKSSYPGDHSHCSSDAGGMDVCATGQDSYNAKDGMNE